MTDGATTTAPTSSGWRGLRGRVTLALAAVALVLSTTTVSVVWVTVSRYLLGQRERSTLAQTTANADALQRGLQAQGLTPPQLLAQLPREIGSTSLLADDGEWSTTSLQVGRDDLPAALREAVLGGQASRQRIEVGGRTVLAVGVPLAGLDDAYFEVYPLDELDSTYRALGLALALAGAAVPLASLALGWWATGPALRPLDRVSAAAAAIASGDLRARIDPRGDAALAPIAASFNQTAAALEDRVRADARFAADVAHELRSPLTTLVSAVALLQDHRDRLPEEGREGLDLLALEVDRFRRLVLDLLEISRTDAGNADVDLSSVVLADLVRRTLPDRLAGRLQVDADAAGVVVRTDKRRLERVVANLVDNAEQHGGGLTRVVVDRAGERVRVAVDDAGPGVADAERERVFERFARGRGSARASTDGTGLGLSLVVRHLQLLGGSVAVERSPEGGARFVVTLPVEEVS